MNRIATNRVFLDNLAIKKPASLSEFVDALSLFGSHSLFHYERIIFIFTPLFVEWDNASASAIRDDISNPAEL